MDLNIEKFSPTRAELVSLVEKAKTIDLLNPFDDLQLANVKEARAELRSTRTAITKRGKELRDDALAFQRAVIATERDLIAIIEPEEERLATLIEAATEMRDREARRELVPHRMSRIEAIGDGEPFPGDDVLLGMDGPAFEAYFNKRQADHNEKIRIANEEKERELRAEEERQRHEREAQERARKEERERIEQEQKEAEARALREKEEEERKAEEERQRQEQDARFKAFLQENGYTLENAQDFKIDYYVDKAILWKKVAMFEKQNTEK